MTDEEKKKQLNYQRLILSETRKLIEESRDEIIKRVKRRLQEAAKADDVETAQ